jgi:hypothetical protein
MTDEIEEIKARAKARAMAEKYSTQERSTLQKIGRQVGLTARAVLEGNPVSAFGGVVGRAVGLDTPGALSRTLTRAGLPEPENATERVVQAGAQGMAGGAGFAGLAGKAGLTTLAQSPGLQTVSGGIGAATAQATGEAGFPPWLQLGAGVGASMIPGAVPSIGARMIRGGESNIHAAEQRISQFKEAGVTPSVAQAFPTHQAQAYESFLSRGPGSHGIMRDFAVDQAKQMGLKVDQTAEILSGKTSPMIAGRAVEDGIRGEGGFLAKFRTTESGLYDQLDQYIPAQKPVEVSRTVQALKELNKEIPNAPNLSQWFKNARIEGIEKSLEKDMAGTAGSPATPSLVVDQTGKPAFTVPGKPGVPDRTTMPYESIKQLRTLVGRELADANIISDVPRSKWKALYAALSQDMMATAAQSGKDAEKAWERANTYSRVGHQRIENVIDPILKKGDPEKIFTVIFTGGKEGDTLVHGIMQSLPQDSQKVLAASVLKKMGKALPGQQTADGDVFSIDRYLTNWNTISKEAKRSLFSRFGPGFVEDLDKIAKTASDIKTGSKVYANPSGTAPALTLQHTAGGAMIAILTGHVGLAGAIAGEVATANLSARAFTNPRFVKWLAKSTNLGEDALPMALNQLAQDGKKFNDPTLIELSNIQKHPLQRGEQ